MKYLLLFLSILFIQSVNAETCYVFQAPQAYPDGNQMVYYCHEGWQHIMPENECRAVVPCPDVPEPPDPECVSGFEKVYNNIDNSLVGCMRKCPSGQLRNYFPNGDPMDSCYLDCKAEDGMMIENDQCVPLLCYNPNHELVITPFKPFRQCVQKCNDGYERSWEKYQDMQCHKKCPSGEIAVGNTCVKPQPDPDPEEETDCSTIVGSIKCLKKFIIEALDHFSTINDDLGQTINVLDDVSNAVDNINFGENTNNNNDYDTSLFNADVPFRELNETLLDKNKFSSHPSCPADNTFTIWTKTYSFSYVRICNALETLSHLVMILSLIIASYIIVRKS